MRAANGSLGDHIKTPMYVAINALGFVVMRDLHGAR
jgi:hypothetical protein